jgi:hypothetical protein
MKLFRRGFILYEVFVIWYFYSIEIECDDTIKKLLMLKF